MFHSVGRFADGFVRHVQSIQQFVFICFFPISFSCPFHLNREQWLLTLISHCRRASSRRVS
ncbi:hypothetical protein RRSWK_00360 [Rhodopirellula sp. SWK7]|nr:hypothetical protein RRSWK_00360 [Rhodopirellula sp. SWK7]